MRLKRASYSFLSASKVAFFGLEELLAGAVALLISRTSTTITTLVLGRLPLLESVCVEFGQPFPVTPSGLCSLQTCNFVLVGVCYFLQDIFDASSLGILFLQLVPGLLGIHLI